MLTLVDTIGLRTVALGILEQPGRTTAPSRPLAATKDVQSGGLREELQPSFQLLDVWRPLPRTRTRLHRLLRLLLLLVPLPLGLQRLGCEKGEHREEAEAERQRRAQRQETLEDAIDRRLAERAQREEAEVRSQSSNKMGGRRKRKRTRRKKLPKASSSTSSRRDVGMEGKSVHDRVEFTEAVLQVRAACGRARHPHRCSRHSACREPEFSPQEGGCRVLGGDEQAHRGEGDRGGHGGGNHPQERAAGNECVQ